MICLPNNPRALALINCYGGEDEPLTFDDFPGNVWFDASDESSFTFVDGRVEVFGNKKDGSNNATPITSGVRPLRMWDGNRWVVRCDEEPLALVAGNTSCSTVIVCGSRFYTTAIDQGNAVWIGQQSTGTGAISALTLIFEDGDYMVSTGGNWDHSCAANGGLLLTNNWQWEDNPPLNFSPPVLTPQIFYIESISRDFQIGWLGQYRNRWASPPSERDKPGRLDMICTFGSDQDLGAYRAELEGIIAWQHLRDPARLVSNHPYRYRYPNRTDPHP